MNNQFLMFAFRRHGWLIESFHPILRIAKQGVFAEIIPVKTPEGEKRWQIGFPKYHTYSKFSHFAPVIEDEVRYRRQKTILISFIRALQRARIWRDVINKEFITLNPHNEKFLMNKKTYKAEHDRLEKLGIMVRNQKPSNGGHP